MKNSYLIFDSADTLQTQCASGLRGFSSNDVSSRAGYIGQVLPDTLRSSLENIP